MAPGDKRPKWRCRRPNAHTETKPYLRNSMVPRHFVGSSHMRWWRTDWLAARPGKREAPASVARAGSGVHPVSVTPVRGLKREKDGEPDHYMSPE
jgi:hypothetical protein